MRKLILTPYILILCLELQGSLELKHIRQAKAQAKTEAKKKDKAPALSNQLNKLNKQK